MDPDLDRDAKLGITDPGPGLSDNITDKLRVVDQTRPDSLLLSPALGTATVENWTIMDVSWALVVS